MQEIALSKTDSLPFVQALAVSPERRQRVRLVFDTGAAVTQFDVKVIEGLGFSARDAFGLAAVRGCTGEAVDGYLVKLKLLSLFGRHFKDVPVLAYDFAHADQIDGLLGFDLIRTMHLELNGPRGQLRVY